MPILFTTIPARMPDIPRVISTGIYNPFAKPSISYRIADNDRISYIYFLPKYAFSWIHPVFNLAARYRLSERWNLDIAIRFWNSVPVSRWSFITDHVHFLHYVNDRSKDGCGIGDGFYNDSDGRTDIEANSLAGFSVFPERRNAQEYFN